MTIDAYVDENNADIEEHNDDSVWNFHVWNEVFLTGRGHWPSTYAGWAAVDATPQESSNNIMQCGPAPIKAIKEGHIYIGYDSNFVFGEVNADRITWICQKSGTDSGPFLILRFQFCSLMVPVSLIRTNNLHKEYGKSYHSKCRI